MNKTISSPLSEINNISSSLADYIGQTMIIAYKESTDLLESTLNTEKLACEVLRQEPLKETKINYSPSYLCMMNHRRGWEKTIEKATPSLIVEADFVPVIGIGELPIPFNPEEKKLGIAWLYTCAPQVYYVSAEGYATGYSTSMVAYIITPESAKSLIDLSDEIIQEYGETKYSTWDSEVENFLRSRGFKNYLPFRNYGEHGGIPNPEHKKNGLSTTHRADILYGKLAFMPDYATQNNFPKLQIIRERILGRLKGIARLLTGKFLRLKVLKQSSLPKKLLSFVIGRQLTLLL